MIHPPDLPAGSTGRGFTLIELMTTVTVAAVVLTVGVPNFQTLVGNNEKATIVNQLVGALNLARSEAIKRGAYVSICKSSNGSSCTTTGTQWEDGWIVFVNGDNDKPAQVDTGETILRIFASIDSGYTLRPSDNFTNYVTYLPSGRSNNIGRFVLCHDNQLQDSRVVFINNTGRVRRGEDSNGNGIPEDESGTDIASCNP